jgi:hypothetical protein
MAIWIAMGGINMNHSAGLNRVAPVGDKSGDYAAVAINEQK